MATKRRIVEAQCHTCGALVTCQGPTQLAQVRRGRVYCSATCRDKALSISRSHTMAQTNRKYASDRMKRKNPMLRPETRAKISTALRVRGWKPPVRGGNGHGPTIPELLLASALGWPCNVIVPIRSGQRRQSYPPHYKIDVGNPALKIAIEINGFSHRALVRQAQDQKKRLWLESRGWSVLTFSNGQVKNDLATCVQTVLSTISKLRVNTTTSPTESA